MFTFLLLTSPYSRLSAFELSALDGFGVGRLILAPTQFRGLLTSNHFLAWLQIAGIAGCVSGLIVGRRANVAVSVAFLAVVSLDAIAKSVGGFANHAQALPLMLFSLVAACSLSPKLSKRVFFDPPHTSRPGWGSADFVNISTLLVILPYTYIGLQRLVSGGVDMFTGDVLLRYLSAATGSFEGVPEWIDPIALRPILNFGFAVVTLCEVSTVCVLLDQRYRLVWLIVMSGFHVSTLVAMNVFFWENLVLTATVFWWGWRQDD